MKKLLALTLLMFFIILTPGLTMAGESTEAFQEEYDRVKAMVDRVEEMKAEGDQAWKSQVMVAFRDAYGLYSKHPAAAETSFLVARCFYYNNRPGKASKALRKTFYYDSAHVGAHILKGDIAVAQLEASVGDMDTNNSAMISTAKRAYNKALKLHGIGEEDKSLVYLKLGDFYYQHARSKGKAIEQWEKAVETAPDSSAAAKASKRLSEHR